MTLRGGPVKKKKAVLVLEDGRYFKGHRFGSTRDIGGEVVFNTSMMGYPEILTDPSYSGQIVVMTYPMIGNYGISQDDFEARQTFAAGLIVKENSRIPSNWRCEHTLEEYLEAQGTPGLAGLDTRALVKHLRDRGSMRGMILDCEEDEPDIKALVERVKTEVATMAGTDLAKIATAGHTYHWGESSLDLTSGSLRPDDRLPDERPDFHVVVYDFGVKRSILRQLVAEGCRVTVVPADTSYEAVLAMSPDGLMLSNGPGDPEPVMYAVENVKALIGKLPIFGICLGHQILSLAIGAKSYKLKFGHRGGNHPVKDLQTGKVEITSHNHGFSIDADSLPPELAEATHINLNDGTLEGFRLKEHPAFGVQYHPEASPGPHDANYLFKRFVSMMEQWKSQPNGADSADEETVSCQDATI